MKVEKVKGEKNGGVGYRLLDDTDRVVEEVDGFLRFLTARNCSPNTIEAYAYDLLRFYRFLDERDFGWEEFTAARSVELLEYLRRLPARRRGQRPAPSLVIGTSDLVERIPVTKLSPASVNRVIATISFFYEYLILSGKLVEVENPIRKRADYALARVPDRHRPFAGRLGRQRSIRRALRVKTAVRVPRPMSEEQVRLLLADSKKSRDRAMLLLMLRGGLRPGEVLCLKLEDIQYGRRRVVIRHYADHPKGARTKSRTERVVDLLDHETLAALSTYVMQERPRDAESPFIFLVGGGGKRRLEPLSYWALIRAFERRCERLGIRKPWITPHALRHTHATEMWEGGMRELALQKRLGHSSPESTRVYTRVSDSVVAEEYRRALGEAES